MRRSIESTVMLDLQKTVRKAIADYAGEQQDGAILIKPKPDVYWQDFDDFKLPKGKILFLRDPNSTISKGGIYLPDKAQESSLVGSVGQTAEGSSYRVGQRILIRGKAIAYPMAKDFSKIIMSEIDVVATLDGMKTLEDIHLHGNRVMLMMESDITHRFGLELPHHRRRPNVIGQIIAVAAGATSHGIPLATGMRAVLRDESGLALYDDLEGIQFDKKVMIVPAQSVIMVIGEGDA